jgi:Helix-turn-helix domain
MPISTTPFGRPADALEPLAYTLPEAARISGLSISTLRRHWKRGALDCPRVGGRRLVDARSLRRLIRGDAG